MVVINRAYFWILLVTCAVIGACSPNKADLPVPTPKIAQVEFLNLIPTPFTSTDAINLYINGTRQNSNQIAYALNSSYMGIVSGPQTVLFKDSLRNNIFDPTTITIPTDSSTFYVTTRSLSGLIYSRDTTKADLINYKPQVRFIHAAADGSNYDLVLNKVNGANTVLSTTIIANKAYKAISAYSRIDSGRVIVNLTTAGTSTIVASQTYTLGINKVYTIFVYGSVKGVNGAGINLGVITNH